METTVIDKELYSQIDEFSYTIEDLKHATYILAECLRDSDFTQNQLASLATIIQGRIATLTDDIIHFMETIEYED